MTPLLLAITFLVVAIVLFVADLIVPSHAVFTALGVLSLLAAVACTFAMSAGTGFVVLAVALVLSPVGAIVLLKLWPATPAGRKLILPEVASERATSPSPTASTLRAGETGVAVTALRPTGLCEFGGTRVEALSDRGILDRDTRVVIVSLENNRPIVRRVDEGQGPTI